MPSIFWMFVFQSVIYLNSYTLFDFQLIQIFGFISLIQLIGMPSNNLISFNLQKGHTTLKLE